MFRKNKISDSPLTYQFFETFPHPKANPKLYLGRMTELREGEDHFEWESSFGGSSGVGPADVCMNMIQKCARNSDRIREIKKRGMQG